MKTSTIVSIVAILVSVSLTILFSVVAYNKITLFIETVSNQAMLQSYIERSYAIDSVNEYVISSALGFLLVIIVSLVGIKMIKDCLIAIIER